VAINTFTCFQFWLHAKYLQNHADLSLSLSLSLYILTAVTVFLHPLQLTLSQVWCWIVGTSSCSPTRVVLHCLYNWSS